MYRQRSARSERDELSQSLYRDLADLSQVVARLANPANNLLHTPHDFPPCLSRLADRERLNLPFAVGVKTTHRLLDTAQPTESRRRFPPVDVFRLSSPAHRGSAPSAAWGAPFFFVGDPPNVCGSAGGRV